MTLDTRFAPALASEVAQRLRQADKRGAQTPLRRVAPAPARRAFAHDAVAQAHPLDVPASPSAGPPPAPLPTATAPAPAIPWPLRLRRRAQQGLRQLRQSARQAGKRLGRTRAGPLIYALYAIARAGQIRRLMAKLTETVVQQQAQIDQIGAMTGRIEATLERALKLDPRLQQIEQRLHDLDHRVSSAAHAVRELERSASWAPPGKLPPADAPTRPAALISERFYLDLENALRGPEQVIQQRLQAYQPTLERMRGAIADDGVEPQLLDIGCGRGEWLKLLAADGWNACGVDQSAAMVDVCHRHGLRAYRADAFDWLHAQADASYYCVSAFHVIEHLGTEDQLHLLDLIFQKLKPGGWLILETPNPDNLRVASSNFYLDPTHVRPLPSTLLKFMAAHRGFAECDILPLNPYSAQHHVSDGSMSGSVLNALVFGAQDYALIARKPV